MSKHPILLAEGLGKTYMEAGEPVTVLQNVSFSVAQAESVAIVGSSGSGKSTLLNMLGGLDRSDQGAVYIAGEDISKLSEGKRCALRNQKLGFVYQFHHLLPEFTALENVAMPLMIGSSSAKDSLNVAASWLDKVGLGHRVNHKPAQLSGGERQRVAIARALVSSPDCVLMDEPTGNLDRQTAGSIYDLIRELNCTAGLSFVIVTHDLIFAGQMDRVLELRNGQLCPINLSG